MAIQPRSNRRAHTTHLVLMQVQFVSIASTVAFSKDAFPTAGILPANPSSSLPKQAQFSGVSRQAQFRLSFALRSLAARPSQGIALHWTCVLEPLAGAALA
jgi:hypothetical protein